MTGDQTEKYVESADDVSISWHTLTSSDFAAVRIEN